MSTLFYSALYLFYLGLCVWAIFKWRFFEVEGAQKKHFAFFFLLKVVAGIFLTLVYTYYYTDQSKADIYRYFNDSKVISPLLFSHPLVWLKIMTGWGIKEPGVFQYLLSTQYFSHPGSDIVTNNTFIIRVNVLLNYLSFSNIFINTLFLNFVSFTALTALFKALRGHFSGFQEVLYLPLYLLPGVVFWSSGLLKESLLFTGVSLYLSYYLAERRQVGWQMFLAFVGIVMVAYTKIQLVALTIALEIVFLSPNRSNRAVLRRLFIMMVMLMVGGYFWGATVCTMLIEKRNEFVELALKENAGSYFDTQVVEPSVVNLLKLVPEAFVNAVFRPFVWDSGNLFQKVFGVENLLFLLLLIIPLRYFKFPTGDKLLVCLCFLLFAIANYLLIVITVPIMGAIVHYRVIAEPFLLISVLLMTDLERWKKVMG